ncbi:MAG: GtrA family protein [Actinomycetes bacterium]
MPHSSAPARSRVRSEVATAFEFAKFKLSGLWQQVAKFGAIGAMAFVVDVGIFNFLVIYGGLSHQPLTAKVLSVLAATTFAYFGNRFWTFRDRGRTSMTREYVLFVVLNVIGMGIALGCLWFSHYALGLTSVLADNISANIVGLFFSMLFRFWAYRKWVFPEATSDVTDEELLRMSDV